jgi:hypothetical protein
MERHNQFVAVHNNTLKGDLTMQKEFTENWSKLCQCVSKPMSDLTELNISTLNTMTKNAGSFEEFTQAKKPEEVLVAQLKLANAACLEATKYMQKAMEIGISSMSEAGKVWAESLNKTAMKASDFVKAGTTSKGKE